MKNFIIVCTNFFVVILITTSSLFSQNILDNGDFESTPPSIFGNNVGYSVTPWILGSGQSSNVVKVDGPAGYNYGIAGPESDAAPANNSPSSPRHYLDISGGSNSFYQSFTPQCSGTVTVGGFFSTRANKTGKGSIEIRQGNGLNGIIVGQSIPVSLPGGNSKLDAWTPVSTQVNIIAGQTYSFIVSMDNNLNFDEGYAIYNSNCGAFDPCCPPLTTKEEFTNLFREIPGSRIGMPYTIQYVPSSNLNSKMQAYINYLKLVCGANKLNLEFSICEMNAAGTSCLTSPPHLETKSVIFTANTAAPIVPALFTTPLSSGKWYQISLQIKTDPMDAKCFEKNCNDNLKFKHIDDNKRKTTNLQKG